MVDTQQADDGNGTGTGGADPIQSPGDRLYALLSGHFAGGYDAAAARLAMDRKRRVWLEGQGRLDARTDAALEARIASGEQQARARLDDLAGAVATPVPQAGAMTLSGRVVRDGAGVPELTVSALDPKGKALACGKTGPGGMFRFTVKKGDQAVLMVADAGGKPLLVDDRSIPIEPGGTAYRLLDLSGAGKGACPDGPDLSGRIVMPDLVKLPLEEAVQVARRQGIEIAKVDVTPDKGPDHVVLSTDPKAGRLLGDPPRANLVISGPQRSAVDVGTVGAVMKARDDIKVPDATIDRAVAGLRQQNVTTADDMKKLARSTDRRVASMTGLAEEDAGMLRRAIGHVLKQITGLSS
ncbi:MAG: PASTA domain-containing protein [Alphaproteobacteria bacterium]|nr:PASTA domain-containing protein [Alphaproteobacteria bacterium]MBV9373200.1 PASTA domain-containing protein [Alphaproteobacteria bacterium]MBV9900289.1 PASTA domain-containing protein [Alphaproteobacteria bacterium]